MSKPSLSLPPLTGITDRNTQSALQAIANWARQLNADYVSRDELKLSQAATVRTVEKADAAPVPVNALTLTTLAAYLNSTAASILATSENLIETDKAGSTGVKIGRSGVVGYNGSGQATFTLDARTGDASFYGTVTGGSIVGTTNVSSAGYIYATGVNASRTLSLGGNTIRGVIVGEEAQGMASSAGLMGIANGSNSVGGVGWVSGSGSLGLAGVATGENGVGVYGTATGTNGLAGQFAGKVDFLNEFVVGTGNAGTTNRIYNTTRYHGDTYIELGKKLYYVTDGGNFDVAESLYFLKLRLDSAGIP